MISRKEAFQILKLKPGANKYEIENRYTVLAKAYRGRTDPESEEEIRRFTLAYDILTGRYVEPEPEDPRMDDVILGRKRREWKNLWAYGKVPLLVTTIVLVIIGSIIYSVVNRVVPDYVIQFYGFFAMEGQDTDRAEQFLFDSNSYLEEIRAEGGVFLPDEDDEDEELPGPITEPLVAVNQYFEGNDAQMNYASSLRLMLVVSGADPVDLMITDLAIFEMYAEQGGFAPLDETYRILQERYPEAVEEYVVPIRMTLPEEVLPSGVEPEERIYGLDFTAMQPFNRLGVYGGSQVFMIPVRNGESDQTLAVLSQILDNPEAFEAGEEHHVPTPTISPTPHPSETDPLMP